METIQYNSVPEMIEARETARMIEINSLLTQFNIKTAISKNKNAIKYFKNDLRTLSEAIAVKLW